MEILDHQQGMRKRRERKSRTGRGKKKDNRKFKGKVSKKFWGKTINVLVYGRRKGIGGKKEERRMGR